MDKAQVIQTVIDALSQARDLAASAADQARETATARENIAENKYDTLGLEAAYLAHGQSNRVQQLSEEIIGFANLLESPPSKVVTTGSLVALSSGKQTERWLLIGPGAAGLKVKVAQAEVVVVTPGSPAGQNLSGLEEGDNVKLGDTSYELQHVL